MNHVAHALVYTSTHKGLRQCILFHVRLRSKFLLNNKNAFPELRLRTKVAKNTLQAPEDDEASFEAVCGTNGLGLIVMTLPLRR